jgi:DNA-binding MarR family transcriptional regulator
MDRFEKFIDISEIFMRTVNKQRIVEEIPRKFGTDDLFYKSEIHMIEAIGKYKNENITEIAGRLGVTKGAVSQLVNKLVKNGFVIKINKPDNEKEIILELTDKGKKAYDGHLIFHKNHFNKFLESFKDVSDEQMLFVENLFKKIEMLFDEFIKCECENCQERQN